MIPIGPISEINSTNDLYLLLDELDEIEQSPTDVNLLQEIPDAAYDEYLSDISSMPEPVDVPRSQEPIDENGPSSVQSFSSGYESGHEPRR